MSKFPSQFADSSDGDLRPMVRVDGSNRGTWLFAVLIVAFAVMLFYLLEARREPAVTSPIGPAAGTSEGRITAPPDLLIPRTYPQGDPATQVIGQPVADPSANTAQPALRADAPAYQPPARAVRYIQPDPPAPLPYVPPLPQANYDGGALRPIPVANNVDPASQQDRVKAFRFLNPATTVPKGAIVQAVLETALDSTRPGFVRAIVTRDVSGFDGSRILIPRGSRLVGEYKSDLAPGQNRALIQWLRLMRPDGVVINLDSPAIDPLGRAGVRGKVDSHLLERFAGALLQTAVNIGSQAALNRATNSTVVYAVPVAGQAPQTTSPDRVQRTLKVKQGTSVSVFVAKDLDFTTVEQ